MKWSVSREKEEMKKDGREQLVQGILKNVFGVYVPSEGLAHLKTDLIMFEREHRALTDSTEASRGHTGPLLLSVIRGLLGLGLNQEHTLPCFPLTLAERVIWTYR